MLLLSSVLLEAWDWLQKYRQMKVKWAEMEEKAAENPGMYAVYKQDFIKCLKFIEYSLDFFGSVYTHDKQFYERFRSRNDEDEDVIRYIIENLLKPINYDEFTKAYCLLEDLYLKIFNELNK